MNEIIFISAISSYFCARPRTILRPECAVHQGAKWSQRNYSISSTCGHMFIQNDYDCGTIIVAAVGFIAMADYFVMCHAKTEIELSWERYHRHHCRHGGRRKRRLFLVCDLRFATCHTNSHLSKNVNKIGSGDAIQFDTKLIWTLMAVGPRPPNQTTLSQGAGFPFCCCSSSIVYFFHFRMSMGSMCYVSFWMCCFRRPVLGSFVYA